MDLHRDLDTRILFYNERARLHKAHSSLFRILHYCLGWPQVLLIVVITALTGSKQSDTIEFVLGLIASVIAVSLTFFRIQERGSKHHISAMQWTDLALDLATSEKLDESFGELERTATEKEKFIRSYEPPFCKSDCLGVICKVTS